LVGDIRRASCPIAQWPHVKLLRQFESIGDKIWDEGVFEETAYYRNAALNIEFCGRYFDAVLPENIHLGARRFINCFLGIEEALPPQAGQSDPWNLDEYISVRPVKDATCYEVVDGHHRLAMAHVRGVQHVQGLILEESVTTPVRDLLLDVMWLKGRRELYQPIDSPEVADWVLVRRCADRLAKMTRFLQAEGFMPPKGVSYLDVACSYGWFVSEMQKAGFIAAGVERDPFAISVGKEMYGLRPEQLFRSDVVTFLRTVQGRYDVTSCFSLAHHFVLNRLNVTAEDLLHLLDSVTGHVMFFDTGQCHEEFFLGGALAGWDAAHIHQWLKENTTFSRIEQLGIDEDAVPPFQESYGRMLFACMR
jgi:2-polyprenyl-3-methyl-5-hydroxy-6-metoxy-1,4-benzoquinol methylase